MPSHLIATIVIPFSILYNVYYTLVSAYCQEVFKE